DVLDAELEQEFERRAERVDTEHIECSAFVASGSRAIFQFVARPLDPVLDGRPSDPRGLDAIHDSVRYVEQSDALRSEQPLVGVGREDVNAITFDVERQRAKSLNRVDDEEHAALAAKGADAREVGSESARELHPAQREHARAVVHESKEIVWIESSIALGRLSVLDALAREPHPRVDVRRKLTIGA